MIKPIWHKEKTEDGWRYTWADYAILRMRVHGRWGWEIHCVAYCHGLPMHDGTLHMPGKSSLPRAKDLCKQDRERRLFCGPEGLGNPDLEGCY